VDDAKFIAGQGCTYCNLAGYRGRIAVYELLEIDRTLADHIRRCDVEGFTKAARISRGYVPIAQGTIDLALAGTTSLAEAMAAGSGLEEFVEAPNPPAARSVGTEAAAASGGS
jgi:MSHA biogenesis protein MshE